MRLSKWVAALMIALLMAPTGAMAGQAGEDVECGMLKLIYEQQGQFVCSPLSLKLALSMAAEGARGQTLQELLDALNTDAPRAVDLSGYAQLQSANAALVSDKISLLDAYRQALAGQYRAELFPLDEDVVSQVNAWVDQHTNGMIKEMLTEQPGEMLRLILLNALALDAEWQAKFDPERTKDATFRAPGGKLKVPFMRLDRSLPYAEAGGAQAVKLAYVGDQLEMVVILPEQGGMDEALTRLSEQGLNWLGEFSYQGEVRLALPKFSMESSLDLNQTLRALGVNRAFEMDADFSGMTGGDELYIGQVLQRARIDVDEDGTRAAAATAIIMEAKGISMNTIEMTVDRPFIALVRGVENGELLFAAVVENPKA